SGYSRRIVAPGNYTSALVVLTTVGSNRCIARGKDRFVALVSLALESAGHWNITLFADNVSNERDAVFGNPFAGVPLPVWDVRVRPRTVGVQFDYQVR